MEIGLGSLPGALDPLPGGKSLVNAVDYIVNWARASSLWPLVYGTSCCAIEMMATGAAKHDIARFGAEVFRASPRQADLIILAGTLTEKMSDQLRTLYEQMPAPKYVIAMGACTISGGPFYYDNYSVIKGADRVIPVDVFVPGCPPRPEALLNGILELQDIIKNESIRSPRVPPALNTSDIRNLHKDAEDEWKKQDVVRQEEFEGQREQWLADHPDYKAYKHLKVDKGKFDAVDRIARKRVGLKPWELYRIISERFDNLSLYEVEEVTQENIDALGEEYILDVIIDKDRYQTLIAFLKSNNSTACEMCLQVTAIDWLDRIDVCVHMQSLSKKHKIFIRVSLDRDEPVLDTISHLYKGANWHEREVFEMYGVVFAKHPDLRQLLLPDGFKGFPLRKDFKDPSRIVERPY